MREARRALDRAEERVLRLEREIMVEINKYGSLNYDIVVNLTIAYVDRARERRTRGTATPDDCKILARYDNAKRRATDTPDQS